ncbi:MAG: sce7726 family protein [Ruminococcus sp.]|nr:sce7726 family protein [Ruminococcus sp.]MCH5299385.1 sce7726 family protein [Ruminococcus sp.]
MAKNNIILNRLFTQNTFSDMIHFDDTSIFDAVIRRYINDPEDKSNEMLISEIYSYMSNEYRNEYFYQNTLLNKLLLGKHSVNTTTALTQIPISKSKADFILINGKAVVYEIKTALDTFERLNTQIRDYYKAFNHVCVVTSEHQFEQACEILKDTNVGVYCLTSQETLSMTKRKEPIVDNSQLDHTTIFKILHKPEFESIIIKYFGELPKTSQVFYYGECLERFSKIPIIDAYTLFLKELKKRNKIEICSLNKIPYELKSLIYFLKPSDKDWQTISQFLTNTHR